MRLLHRLCMSLALMLFVWGEASAQVCTDLYTKRQRKAVQRPFGAGLGYDEPPKAYEPVSERWLVKNEVTEGEVRFETDTTKDEYTSRLEALGFRVESQQSATGSIGYVEVVWGNGTKRNFSYDSREGRARLLDRYRVGSGQRCSGCGKVHREDRVDRCTPHDEKSGRSYQVFGESQRIEAALREWEIKYKVETESKVDRIARQDLRGEDIGRANLPFTVFEGVDGVGLKFELANLTGAKIRNSDLSDSSGIGAQMDRAVIENTSFERADLDGSSWVASTVRGVNLRSADLQNTRFSQTVFERPEREIPEGGEQYGPEGIPTAERPSVDMSRADLSGSNWRGIETSEGVVAANTRWEEARFEDVRFSDFDLRGALFFDATGKEVKFMDSRAGSPYPGLTEAVFEGGKWEELQVHGAQMNGTRFVNTNIDGIVFHTAGSAGLTIHGSSARKLLFGTGSEVENLRVTESDLSESNFNDVKLTKPRFTRSLLANSRWGSAEDAREQQSQEESPSVARVVGGRFENVDFTAAQLGFAEFIQSEFIGGSMVEAQAVGTSFEGSSFKGSIQLAGIQVGEGTSFKEADLRGADGVPALQAGIIIDGANISSNRAKKDLTGSELNETYVAVILEGATLNESAFGESTWSGGSWKWVRMKGGSIEEATFEPGQSLEAAKFEDVNARGAVFDGTNSKRVEFRASDLEGVVFGCGDFGRAKFLDSNFGFGAQLSEGNFTGVVFRGSELPEANFRGNRQVENADFRGVDLRLADFTDASVKGARFQGADLRRAELAGTDMTDVKHDKATQWEGATFDKASILPFSRDEALRRGMIEL